MSASLTFLTPEKHYAICWSGDRGSSRLLCCSLQEADVCFYVFRTRFLWYWGCPGFAVKTVRENHHPLLEWVFFFSPFLWPSHEKTHFYICSNPKLEPGKKIRLEASVLNWSGAAKGAFLWWCLFTVGDAVSHGFMFREAVFDWKPSVRICYTLIHFSVTCFKYCIFGWIKVSAGVLTL